MEKEMNAYRIFGEETSWKMEIQSTKNKQNNFKMDPRKVSSEDGR
jgi:hypothetical protein